MYTVCWIDSEGKDKWDRFENAEEVMDLLVSENLLEDDDCLIFPPQTEEMGTDYFVSNYYSDC